MKFCFIGLTALLLSSCINQDYDLSKKINMDMTIGAGGLSIPVGTTEPIKLTELIKESEVIKLENGQYSIRKSGAVEDTRVDIEPVIMRMKAPRIDPVEVDFTGRTVGDFQMDDFQSRSSLNAPEVDLKNIAFNRISQTKIVEGAPFPEAEVVLGSVDFIQPEASMECVFEFDIPEEVKEVKTVYLGSGNGQRVDFRFDFSQIVAAMKPDGLKQMITDFEILFPKGFELVADKECAFSSYMQVMGNRIILKDAPLGVSQTTPVISFFIKSVELNATSRKFRFADQIKYRSKYRLQGTTAGKPIKPVFSVLFDEHFAFHDADIITNPIAFDLPKSNISMQATISDLDDIRIVDAVTFENSKVVLQISDPGLPVNVNQNGLVVVELSSLFDYRLEKAPAGVVLNGYQLTIPGNVLFGASVRLDVLRAGLSGIPVVDNRLDIISQINYRGQDLFFDSRQVRIRELEGLGAKELNLTLKGGLFHVADAEVVLDAVRTEVETKASLSVNEKVPDELRVLHRIGVDASTAPCMHIRLDFPADFPSGIDLLTLENFKIHLPEFISCNDPRVKNHVLVLNDSFNPKNGYRTSVLIEGMDFLSMNGGEGILTIKENGETRLKIDSDNELVVAGTIIAEGGKVGLDDLKKIVVTPEVVLDDIALGVVKGYLEPEIEPVQEVLSLDLGDELDFLKQDAMLNLHNPQINLKIGNSMKVPVDININLTARDEENVMLPGAEVKDIRLYLPPANVSGEMSYTNFLISKQGTVKDGYQSVKVESLSDLLTVLPESIEIGMTAFANQETPHEIDLSASVEKQISAEYEVVVPLRFEAIDLNYIETIDGLKEDLKNISANQQEIQIELKTKVVNSIPLDLTLSVIGYDSDKQKIEGITSERCPISAGTGADPGVETKVILKIIVAKGAFPELESLDLVIHGNAEETKDGVALEEHQFVQLNDIRLKILGGVNINFDNL